LLLRRLRAIHAPALRRRIAIAATLLRHCRRRRRRRLASAFVRVGYFLFVSYMIHIQEQKKIRKNKKN
jgi:hypothetical protein